MRDRHKIRLTTDVRFNWQAEPKPTAQGVILLLHGPNSIQIWHGPEHEINSYSAELETEEAYQETTRKLAKVLQDLFND